MWLLNEDLIEQLGVLTCGQTRPLLDMGGTP